MNAIEILISTWPNHPQRFEYFRLTIEALRKNLSGGGYPLLYSVFAEEEYDPRHRWMGAELSAFCAAAGMPLHWQTAPASLPRLLNRMHASAPGDLRFYCQDDWLLTAPIDLEPAADYLLEHADCAGVRFWANTRYFGPEGPWLDVDRGADWAYGDNPALWHRRFFQIYGPFEEAGDFGTHEARMTERTRGGPLKILAAPEMATNASHFFQHIGNVSSLPIETRWPDRDRNLK